MEKDEKAQSLEKEVKSLEKGVRNHGKTIKEHEQKLEDYKNDPDSQDHKGELKGLTKEERDRRIKAESINWRHKLKTKKKH